ncbi:hypothetical protein P22_3578 [Propionispora sp. 2/2-37]|uniref:septum site-determining protein MinC n=1 Tax=Propionispora sp. 2/2-37 TaxID=1677858 RepID=UPI0006BB6DB2|nr:septum site-determining protein MinC [Propionispora sp. 2/2-37]CUH97448.1 hypothetical protein P22_3578 [Propionispora sp. 2/2-37]
MREDVVFKGSKTGLHLLLSETADFSEVMHQLKEKLDSAAQFFRNGAIVNISSAARILTPEQQGELTDLFTKYGLMWTFAGDMSNNAEQEEKETIPENMVIKRTLRSGQEIIYSGSVVIMGDVNPGAQVIAGGDIIIYGTCRGVVHAGAYGNDQATITANRLMAAQIRIAGLIARSPDYLESPEYVETARVKDGAVVIEPANL